MFKKFSLMLTLVVMTLFAPVGMQFGHGQGITIEVTGTLVVLDPVNADDFLGLDGANFVFRSVFAPDAAFEESSPGPGGSPSTIFLRVMESDLTISDATVPESNGTFAANENPAAFNLAPIYLIEEDEFGRFNGVFGDIQDAGGIGNASSLGFDDIDFFLTEALVTNIDLEALPTPGTPISIDLFTGSLPEPLSVVFRAINGPAFLPAYTIAAPTITIGTGEVLLGDVNCDGIVDLLDVNPFVDLILNGGFNAKADINEDGVVDLLDVNGFVALLLGV